MKMLKNTVVSLIIVILFFQFCSTSVFAQKLPLENSGEDVLGHLTPFVQTIYLSLFVSFLFVTLGFEYKLRVRFVYRVIDFYPKYQVSSIEHQINGIYLP